MPVFRFNKAFRIAGNARAFLNLEGGVSRGSVPDVEERHEDEAEGPKDERRGTSEQREEIQGKRRELARVREELRVAKGPQRSEHIKRAKKIKQELFQLERETGALPDFVVIGGAKCGTTFFYHLLAQHPHVEHAAVKEPHFFDLLFEEGTEWYRRCFPTPRWKDGRRTINGEASPGYIWHPLAPERMAEVVPQARLIALLRNPVHWTYSAYHHRVRNGQEPRTFEEAIEAAFDDPLRAHLSKGIYVDHLVRWSEYFGDEQVLVLKSEDFFERPVGTLKVVLKFLDLPDWEPEASQLGNKRNTGGYGQRMDPATRRRLEEYFEPHNRRLYDYLGVDFGW